MLALLPAAAAPGRPIAAGLLASRDVLLFGGHSVAQDLLGQAEALRDHAQLLEEADSIGDPGQEPNRGLDHAAATCPAGAVVADHGLRDHEPDQVLGALEGLAQELGVLAHGLVGVHALGQASDSDAQALDADQVREGLEGRRRARLVAVEEEHDLVHVALGELGLLDRERRPQRGHELGLADLVRDHDVHVALDDDQALGAGLPRRVEAVEDLALLVEAGDLGAVDVFPLVAVEGPPAEAADLALLVLDREHQAVAEEVIGLGARTLLSQEAEVEEGLDREVAVVGLAEEAVPAVWRDADPKGAGRLLGDPALGQGLATDLAGGGLGPERGLEELRGQGAGPKPGLALGASLALLRGGGFQLDARAGGEALEGLAEGQALGLLDEAEHVAALAAAEAFVEAALRANVEGGALLVVEGAATPEVVGTAAFQLHVFRDERNHVDALANSFLRVVGQWAQRCRPKCWRLIAGSDDPGRVSPTQNRGFYARCVRLTRQVPIGLP